MLTETSHHSGEGNRPRSGLAPRKDKNHKVGHSSFKDKEEFWTKRKERPIEANAQKPTIRRG